MFVLTDDAFQAAACTPEIPEETGTNVKLASKMPGSPVDGG
jgi:hypothetical protein